jgi:zinc/manganese transport system substrate-binding protein
MRGYLFGMVTVLALGWQGLAFGAEKIPVVASFSILGDIVSNVGGERIAVSTLVGPDQDAHVFEPRPADVAKVSRAKLVVINGLGFEGWMARLAKSSGYKGPLVVASTGVKPRQMASEDGHGHGEQIDPHAWQDPTNVIEYVKSLTEALVRLDPAGEAEYRNNAMKYTVQLQALDAWVRAQYARFPAEKRRIITSHDAFGYHGAHYGIEFLAPQGMSTESEASAKDVARLVQQIRREKIKAVFMENMSSPKLIQQLSRDAGVTLAGELYPDALSKENGPAKTYLILIRHNVEEIVAALGRN